MLPGFWGTWLYQSTLFDLANTVLASKCSVETICMNSVSYRTHCHWSDEFQKITTFCRKTVLPRFWGTWLPSNTLIDIVHTALASKFYVKTMCLISEGYRTHRAVTGPRSFKKSRRFVGKPFSRVLGHLAAIKALCLTLQTLFWLVKVL